MKPKSKETNDDQVAKAKYLEAQKKADELESKLSERDKKLNEIDKASISTATLQDEINMLKGENAKISIEYEKRIRSMALENALSAELAKHRVKNPVAIRALLDMDSIILSEGKLRGINKQIQTIKATDGYLFESSASTGGGTNPSDIRENIDPDKLTDNEYFKTKFKE